MEKINKIKTEKAIAKEIAGLTLKLGSTESFCLAYSARYTLSKIPTIVAALEVLQELELQREKEKNPLIVKE